MKKLKIGVMGLGRGKSMINYCNNFDNAELVAICDKWHDLASINHINTNGIAFYDNFDEFIKHDMDVVMLANYANEHAPFAIKAMKAGKDVISEVLPAQCLKEYVELIEAVEETGRKYCYAENYCFMPTPLEMKKAYREGKLGELEYAEGEYIHDCETIWPEITRGEADHWRNNGYAFFYCTHSLGPIVHITGLRPVKVVGIQHGTTPSYDRLGIRSGSLGIEMVTMSNGAVVRSTHGALKRCSIWYNVQGTKGAMESQREIVPENKGVGQAYTWILPEDDPYLKADNQAYEPKLAPQFAESGHGGSDFVCLWNAIEYIRGNKDADIVDVYEAADMALPGLFSLFSDVCGPREQEIPDLRIKAERDKWRNDTRCVDPKVAGDMLLPSLPTGTPTYDQSVYDHVRDMWEVKKAEKLAANKK